MSSALEEAFLLHIRAAGLPEPEQEYKPVPGRRFRTDFAYPALGIAVECEGGTWRNGRHTRGGGYQQDCLKYSLMAIEGWTVIRVTREMIEDGTALRLLVQAFERRRR